MRVPERVHKRPPTPRRVYRTEAVTDVGMREPEPSDWNSGTSWISMMITQRPIAVSIVAGRVCRCGTGLRALDWSVICGLPLFYDFFKKDGRDPKYVRAQSRKRYGKLISSSRKMFQ